MRIPTPSEWNDNDHDLWRIPPFTEQGREDRTGSINVWKGGIPLFGDAVEITYYRKINVSILLIIMWWWYQKTLAGWLIMHWSPWQVSLRLSNTDEHKSIKFNMSYRNNCQDPFCRYSTLWKVSLLLNIYLLFLMCSYEFFLAQKNTWTNYVSYPWLILSSHFLDLHIIVRHFTHFGMSGNEVRMQSITDLIYVHANCDWINEW